MLQFVIAGLVLGGIYAICSAGLVITYTSSGVLNFAFGAIAFFIARFYYFLNTQHTWPILPAAILIFGNEAINTAPGLAPQPVAVYSVIGVAVTLDQVIVYACVLATVIF